MRDRRLVVWVLVLGLLGGGATAGEEPAPEGLVAAALAAYPPEALCEQAFARAKPTPDHDLPVVPEDLEEHVRLGLVRWAVGRPTDGGPRVAVVIYSWWGWMALNRIFLEGEDGWRPLPVAGRPNAVAGGAMEPDDVRFRDLDGDGRREIVLYSHTGSGRFTPYCVSAWRVSGSGLTPVTPCGPHEPYGWAEWWVEPEVPGRPPVCDRFDYAFICEVCATTGVGFMDLDGDGTMELLAYPDLDMEPDPELGGGRFPTEVTGTRVYALVDGVYAKVAETEVGRSLFPRIPVAVDPAMVPEGELEAARSDEPGDAGGSLVLYVEVPWGYDPEAVDWSALRAGEGIAPERVGPPLSSPHPPQGPTPPGWLPVRHAGSLCLLESHEPERPEDFRVDRDDPVIYPSPGARLHMTSAYREARFSRREVLAWVARGWPEVRARAAEAIRCFPHHEGTQFCYVPVSLPVTLPIPGARLGRFPVTARGSATLWIRTLGPGGSGPPSGDAPAEDRNAPRDAR